MKFFPPIFFLTAFASFMRVSAGTFASPIAGQTISSTEPFTLTWTSDKYFKQNSFNISVLLSRSPFTSVLSGVTLIEGLVSPDYGIKTYSAELTPRFFYGDSRTGAFDVVIIEPYSAYGVNNEYQVLLDNCLLMHILQGPQYATDLWIQTVNVV
ncbi:hypothetical protein EDD85DRAFT_932716 [Armillaria nabsnona]|nr:hypothetical protein EDD85DRAFT_932716 [Armillaria nabsnona]